MYYTYHIRIQHKDDNTYLAYRFLYKSNVFCREIIHLAYRDIWYKVCVATRASVCESTSVFTHYHVRKNCVLIIILEAFYVRVSRYMEWMQRSVSVHMKTQTVTYIGISVCNVMVLLLKSTSMELTKLSPGEFYSFVFWKLYT